MTIGTIISTTRNGREVRGRIVGIEDAGCRRGFPAGRLLHVQLPGEDGAIEVHESQLKKADVSV
jgi:hypothetical protein